MSKRGWIWTGLVLAIIAIGFMVFMNDRKQAENILAENDMEKVAREFIWVKNSESDVYYAYEVMGKKEKENQMEIYIWLYATEYRNSPAGYEQGTGASGPVAVYLQDDGRGYRLVNHKVPGDGAMYVEGIKKLFPFYVRWQIHLGTESHNNRADRLEKEIQTQMSEKQNPNFR
jgi:hypothetical protein